MDKLKLHSPNITEANIEKIAELFPSCIVEARDDKGELTRKVDFDQLRQELSDSIIEGPQERYRLDWPGKREALLAANAPIAKTLRPCRGESVDFDTTQNLFIEGDNLDALKLLQETYLEKVKVVYVDPPYNTGNDFVYNDDFKESSDEYFEKSNQIDDKGSRLNANSESNGRFHSDWAAMLYSRLKLARNLLKQDGVIFISIDDNELTNLRKILDELFGAENFISTIVWQRSKKGDSKLIARVHEYIVCYAKNKTSVIEAGVWRRKKEGVDQVLSKYRDFRSALGDDHAKIREAMQGWYRGLSVGDPKKSHKHYNWSDDRGLYFPDNFAGPDDGRVNRPRHDIIHPTTNLPCKKPSTGWRWDESKTNWALEQTPPRIHFGVDESTIPTRKSYLEEVSNEPFSSVFYQDGRSATLDVESLLGKGCFPFPKNTEVLSSLIELSAGAEDIVVDFFAGSGSTGHAIMDSNLKYDRSRRYILVQLPEECAPKSKAFKAGYSNIAEICKKRLRGVGSRINNEHGTTAASLDIGFRVLKIDTSNAKDIYYTPDAISQEELALQVDHIKEDRTAEDLLFQVMLDWGVELALPISKESIQGKDVYFVDENAIAACFDTQINEAFVKELAKRQPLRVVFRDTCFESDSAKINVAEIFKLLSPNTDIKTI